MSRPFADSVWEYRKAGWTGAQPVGRVDGAWKPRRKSPPAAGYTGWAGRDPSGADSQEWADGPAGACNIALHVPVGIYVPDFDVEGRKEAIEAAVGMAFPATWTSTSRGPGFRHQAFYRATLPEGRMWMDHPQPGMDSVHVGHRYAVVWPSIHPDTGDTYLWRDPSGEVYEGVPTPEDLAELPAALVLAMSREGTPLDGSAAGDADTRAAIEAMRMGAPCMRVRRQLEDALRRIDAGRTSGSIRWPGKLHALVCLGIEGHAGVPEALTQHQEAYVAARRSSRGETSACASADWWRQVKGSVGKKLAAAGGEIPETCECDRLAAGAPPLVSAPAPATAEAALPEPADLSAELAALPDESRRRRGRAVATTVGQRAAAGLLAAAEVADWRDFLASAADVTKGDFEAIVREAKEGAKAARAAAARDEAHAAAEREGTLLPAPSKPLDVARQLAAGLPGGQPSHAWWRGDFYGWTGAHWRPVDKSTYQRFVYLATERGRYLDVQAQLVTDWNPTAHKVEQVLDSLAKAILQRPADVDDERCIALRNGVLDPVRMQLLPHTPERFNLHSLPHAYDPTAGCPAWLAFLASSLPDDEDAIAFLQEWAGYLLSGRTDLQKMASLVGPPRCGKGTIARVFRGLLGAENVTTPELGKLGGQFGEEGLIGRTLAIMGDVRWHARAVTESVPVLLGISGEDARSVPRKGRTDWHGTLGVRFMLMSNDAPTFTDASAALASRMIHVEFRRSFLGREDIGLDVRLQAELPGILNWALAGLQRLQERGHFVPPASSVQLAEDVRRMASPVAAFVDDTCDLQPGAAIALADLYAHYRAWCRREGRDHVDTLEVFAKNLRSAHRGSLAVERRGRARDRTRWVVGLLYDGPDERSFGL